MAVDPLRELFEACKTGDVTKVQKLVTPQSVNARDTAGRKSTPLHEAASKCRTEVCSLLLSEGADPTLLNCHNKSAIDSAPTQELKERISYESKGHSILEACRIGDISRLKKYLTSETLNFVHPYTGDTPLHIASLTVHNKRKQIAEVLIKKGSLLNEKKTKIFFLHHYTLLQIIHIMT